MTVDLSPEQERVIQKAREAAVRRMEEFAKEYHLSLGEPITRKLLHEGHRY